MPPRRSGGESKQGLIIALVFFVLATIGLGVATYYGFAGQDALAKDAKDKANAEKEAKDDRDWYKFQSLAYRAYMGADLPADAVEDLKAKRADFDSPSPKLGAKASDRDAVTKLIREKLDRQLRQPNQPQTYEGMLTQMREAVAALTKTNADLQGKLAKAQNDLKTASEEAEAATVAYKKNLEEASKKSQQDLLASTDKVRELTDQIEKLSQEREDIKKKADAGLKAAADQLASSNKTVAQQSGLIKKQQADAEQREQKSEAPANWRTDWKVERVARTKAYINLGSEDNLKPQLTFSVHSVVSGKPVPTPKANLEVVSILQPHLAEGRLVYNADLGQDRGRDPVVAGDVLYNPLWDPALKKHVALAGVMDLRGDGQDHLAELMRLLDKQNVVVDAYLDPRDLAMKGPGMTVQTDYLILGESPEIGGGETRTKERDAEMKRDKLLGDLQKEANQKGVRILSLRRYLELIGYRTVPPSRGTAERAPRNEEAPATTPEGREDRR